MKGHKETNVSQQLLLLVISNSIIYGSTLEPIVSINGEKRENSDRPRTLVICGPRAPPGGKSSLQPAQKYNIHFSSICYTFLGFYGKLVGVNFFFVSFHLHFVFTCVHGSSKIVNSSKLKKRNMFFVQSSSEPPHSCMGHGYAGAYLTHHLEVSRGFKKSMDEVDCLHNPLIYNSL